VRCGEIDLDGLRRDRDQLWAEAVVRFTAGTPWWLEDKELIALAAAAQEARYQGDAWDALIERWLTREKRRVNVGFGPYEDWRDEFVPRAQPLTDVSIGEVLEQALGIEPAKWTKGDQMRVGAFFRARSWQKYRTNTAPREWRYVAPGTTAP
jgi:predicted P-loop ATPase